MFRLFADNVLSEQSKWQWLRSGFRWGASFAEQRCSGLNRITGARMAWWSNQRMSSFTQRPWADYLSQCRATISAITYLPQDQTIPLLQVSSSQIQTFLVVLLLLSLSRVSEQSLKFSIFSLFHQLTSAAGGLETISTSSAYSAWLRFGAPIFGQCQQWASHCG